MSNEYVWQPEGDQENAILAAANHLLRFGHPPVGERLCRRTPAPQAQGVSVPANNMPNDAIISVLHAALIVYITECREVDDADGEMCARQAQQWLDSQRPAPGGEE